METRGLINVIHTEVVLMKIMEVESILLILDSLIVVNVK